MQQGIQDSQSLPSADSRRWVAACTEITDQRFGYAFEQRRTDMPLRTLSQAVSDFLRDATRVSRGSLYAVGLYYLRDNGQWGTAAYAMESWCTIAAGLPTSIRERMKARLDKLGFHTGNPGVESPASPSPALQA